jgi:hypothetical protein
MRAVRRDGWERERDGDWPALAVPRAAPRAGDISLIGGKFVNSVLIVTAVLSVDRISVDYSY